MVDKKSDCRIYVGNLPPDIRSRDIEDLFQKYGKITFVDLKNRKGPPFAFVEFEDPRDADDAVRKRDGYDYDGYRLRVEFPRGNGPYMPGSRSEGGRGGGGGMGYRGGRGGGGAMGPPREGGGGGGSGGGRRTNYRVLVSGLPPTGSWQDLKDHMREAGDVCYADVFKDGTGAVEFLRYDDMKYALRKLDDTKFRSHEGETSYIRVKQDMGADVGNGSKKSRTKSRSRSRTRSRSLPRRPRQSPTYSPARSGSRSGSSASGSRSRSRSRSR
jgi:arginine/serine-rich splicing factor 1/9